MKRPEDMTREELIEEVAYLRRELGLARDEEQIGRVQLALNLTRGMAAMLLVLRAAKGRAVTQHFLAEAVDGVGRMGEQRKADNDKRVDVHIHRLRSRLGPHLIENVWGHGYALTPAGAALVDAALNQTPEQEMSA